MEPQIDPGIERFGPLLPGYGPIISLGDCETGLFVVRFIGGRMPTATYLLRPDASEWVRIWVH